MNSEKYLVTLIGTSPLTSYYSIIANFQTNIKVFGVVTKVSRSTKVFSTKIVGDKLKECIKKKLDTNIDIVLFESDKSDSVNICKIAKIIINTIFSNIEIDEINYGDIEIVLDFTGSTKAMTSIFLSVFRDIAMKYKNIKVLGLYSNAELNKIVNFNLVDFSLEATVDIRDLLESEDITVEDILELHGFNLQIEEKYRVFNSYSNELVSTYDNISLEEGYINVTKDAGEVSASDLKKKYLQTIRNVEKIAGIEGKITFVLKPKYNNLIRNKQEFEESFYNRITNVYKDGIKKRVKLKYK